LVDSRRATADQSPITLGFVMVPRIVVPFDDFLLPNIGLIPANYDNATAGLEFKGFAPGVSVSGIGSHNSCEGEFKCPPA
jgi:hypothetical protein